MRGTARDRSAARQPGGEVAAPRRARIRRGRLARTITPATC